MWYRRERAEVSLDLARSMFAPTNEPDRIFSAPELGGRWVSEDVKLEYTPRNFARNPWFPMYYVIESDANTMSAATASQVLKSASEDSPAQMGLPKAPDHWASCIQAIDPTISKSATATVHLEENETALCIACVPFESRGHEVYLVVGTAQDLNLSQKASPQGARGGGYVHVYKIHDEGRQLEFVHKTRFEQPIHAIHPFKGRFAMGLGNELLIYDLGTKAIMRKSRGLAVPNKIVSLDSIGDRLICGDVAESLTYVAFKPKANRMVPFVDDVVQRWTTTSTAIDYETSAGGDKFGNFWIVRCPPQASLEADEDGMNGYLVNERSYMGGAPYRFDLQAHFHVNDIPTSIQRTPLVAGGQDVLFWSGISGTLGIFVPFVSREDVTFFTMLEQAMRSEEPPLTGRDHLTFRGYYVPVKGVVDGDLCERFLRLSVDGKAKVAADLDRGVREVEKKVTEMRTRVAF